MGCTARESVGVPPTVLAIITRDDDTANWLAYEAEAYFDVVVRAHDCNSVQLPKYRSYCAALYVGSSATERENCFKSGRFCDILTTKSPDRRSYWPGKEIKRLRGLVHAVVAKKNYFFRGSSSRTDLRSVVVWDLDDTIVDGEDRLLIRQDVFARHVKHFDFSVLWSHGSVDHVEKHVRELRAHGITFDYIISRTGEEQTDKKGGGILIHHLNNAFRIHGYTRLELIDDKAIENACDQYTSLVRAQGLTTNDILTGMDNLAEGEADLTCYEHVPVVESDSDLEEGEVW